MEIRTTPTGGGRRHVWGRVLLGVLLAALVGLLAPLALGMRAHVVADGAMGDTVPRGALVYGEIVLPEDLERDDLVVVRVPTDDGAWVTRRIVTVRDEALVTRADVSSAVDPWLVPLDSEPVRVSFYVPWLGFPGLVAGPLVWGLVLLGLAAVAGGAHQWRRRSTGRSRGASAEPTSHLRTITPAP